MSASRPNVFCVTGMHRSGTSLVAAMLAESGVNMGVRLLGPQADNPRGFYEDIEFVRFHEDGLDRRGWTYANPDQSSIEFDDEERRRAGQLVEARSDRGMWGWKDPRTSLFLEAWWAVLPQCRFVVTYRHPLDVVASLVRRGERTALRDVTAGLKMWKTYYRAIVDFLGRCEPPAVVIEAGAVVRDPAAFCAIAGRLGLCLEPERLGPLVQAGELVSLPGKGELEPLLRSVDPEALQLFDDLRARADLPLEGVEPCDDALRSHLRKLVDLSSMASGDARRLIGHSLLTAALYMMDQRVAERMRQHQAEALRADQDVLALEMRNFMAEERAVVAEALATTSALQLSEAQDHGVNLENKLSSLRTYAEQVERDRNRYRRRWPPWVVRRSVQKLRALPRRRLGRAAPLNRFGLRARVCVMLTGMPGEHADAVALRSLLSRQTHAIGRLVLPGRCQVLETDAPAREAVVHDWWGHDVRRLTANHDFTLVVHPQLYGAGVFWAPQIIELLAAALADAPDVAAIVLRGADGPPHIGTPNHLHETDAATIEGWPEETLAAFFRSEDFARSFAAGNPGKTRGIRQPLQILMGKGRRVLVAPQTFCTTRRHTETASVAVGTRLPAQPRAAVKGLYLTQWIECGGADKGIVDLLSRVNPEVVDFSLMTTLAGQQAWESKVAPHAREIVHLGAALPLPAERRFPEFIVEFIRRRDIGLVHIMHSFLAYDALPALKAALPQVTVLDQCHILEPPDVLKGGHPAYSTHHYGQYIDHRTVTSAWLKRYLVSEHGTPENRVSVIYTGVDGDEEFNPQCYPHGAFRRRLGLGRKAKLVVFVGRLYWQKRPWLIARIADQVQRQRPQLDVFFALVGSGPERDRLDEMRMRLPDPTRLILVGEVPHSAPVFRDADLLLLTSGHEGLAYVCYEAMAMNVPQIITDVNGQSELVTPECGVLLPAEDEEAVVKAGARAVIELLEDPTRREMMGRAARDRVCGQFTIDHMVQSYEQLYTTLYSRPPV